MHSRAWTLTRLQNLPSLASRSKALLWEPCGPCGYPSCSHTSLKSLSPCAWVLLAVTSR